MAKDTDKVYPKIIAKTKLKKYERKKGGKLTVKFDKLEIKSDEQEKLNQLVDCEAEVKVTIESTQGFLPNTQ